MRQYLTPDAANPNGVVAAVEFYNRALDHYFLSTNPVEIDNLDSGRTVGWDAHGPALPRLQRARRRARARCAASIARPRSATRTSTRRAPRNARRPRPRTRWTGSTRARACSTSSCRTPTTGACPAGTVAVYRFFNTVDDQSPLHDRSSVIRDEMDGIVPLDRGRLRARVRTIRSCARRRRRRVKKRVAVDRGRRAGARSMRLPPRRRSRSCRT